MAPPLGPTILIHGGGGGGGGGGYGFFVQQIMENKLFVQPFVGKK